MPPLLSANYQILPPSQSAPLLVVEAPEQSRSGRYMTSRDMFGQASIVKATVSGVVSGVTSVVRLEPFRGAPDNCPTCRVTDHALHRMNVSNQHAHMFLRLLNAAALLVKCCSAVLLA